MHLIVKLFGLIQVLVGVVVAVFAIVLLQSPAGLTAAGLTFLLFGTGLIITGALFWCFGAIVEHLVAIRRALESRPDP
jgi:NAD/NADP transhydrogenase beta subunit